MEIDFQQKMSAETDEKLQSYLDNYYKYTPAAIQTALQELKNRGKVFTDSELEVIETNIRNRQEIIEERERSITASTVKNIVDDPNAPLYYSQNAIYMFSVVFSVLAGAILLSGNLKATGNKKAAWQVVLVSIVYVAVTLYALSFLPRNTGLTIAVNGLGAWILQQLYWNKFIGAKTKYRAKPIWKPLIICLIIFTPLVILVVLAS